MMKEKQGFRKKNISVNKNLKRKEKTHVTKRVNRKALKAKRY